MKLKLIVGGLLVVLSVTAMYLWETRFRDQVMMTEVLVPNRVISSGDIVEAGDLAMLKINPEAVQDGALVAGNAGEIVGKAARLRLNAKQQLMSDYFAEPAELPAEGYKHLVIPADWIYSKSVLVSAGDTVTLISVHGQENLGTYRVSYAAPDGGLELLAKLEDYLAIYEACTLNEWEEEMLSQDSPGLYDDGMPYINKLIIVPEKESRTYAEVLAAKESS